ncbi:MAG TPA: hypothetical protein VIJ79_03065 [Acidobacteriaceae bacterium]
MPTPLEYMSQYRDISVDIEDDMAMMCCHMSVRLNSYFMMNWTTGSIPMNEYSAVTSAAGAGSHKAWFGLHSDDIRCAAMGKGKPEDYGLALEWAVYSKRVENSQPKIQTYFDRYMGIDCSGFVTNYLIANGKLKDRNTTRQNTGADFFFNLANAVNDPSDVRQGDLLVFMDGNRVMENHKDGTGGTGHVMVVESFSAQCSVEFPYGSMRVVESTAAKAANPKLSDSIYKVEKIVKKGGHVPCMILVNKRLSASGFHVSVMRP